MHFMDLIKNLEFSAKQEFENIMILLNNEEDFSSSIIEIFDANFIKFTQRGTFINFKQILNYIISRSSNDEELLILLSEMLLSFIKEYTIIISFENSQDQIFSFSNDAEIKLKYLEKHIYNVVDRMHHKVIKVDDDYNFIIVPRENKSIQAAEIVACNDKNIAIKILEYKHFSNTVDDKEKILISIAKYMENKRVDLSDKLNEDNLYLQRNGKNMLVEQMFEMFNKLRIRHNTDKQYIKESEREKWYDYTYNTILTVIIIEEQAKINKEFKRLKDDNRKK